MARALPDNIYIGRSIMSGPTIGPYVLFRGGPIALAAADAANAIHWGFKAPCNMRLMELHWATVAAGTAGQTLDFMKNSTVSITGATTLNTAQIDLTAEIGFATVEAGGTTTIVSAARDINKGDFVFAVTNDAGAALADLNVGLWFMFTGYLHTDESTN